MASKAQEGGAVAQPPQEIKLLIANRGEIAMRIAQTASSFPRPLPPRRMFDFNPAALGSSQSLDSSHHQHRSAFASSGLLVPNPENVRFHTIALHTPSEKTAVHVQTCDSAVEIHPPQGGSGTNEVAAFLDGEQIIRAAKEHGASLIIPGYGFLSESPAFARAIEATPGLHFVGPTSEQLELFGDKIQCKEHAKRCGVPLLPGTTGSHATYEQVLKFVQREFGRDRKVIIKAVAGGGGRGMRIIDPSLANEKQSLEDLVRENYDACSREAKAAFGDERVYAEMYLTGAKHIEVQIIGDGTGDVTHLWDRECTVQRKHQKLIEIAPAPDLDTRVRERLLHFSMRMAATKNYRSLATFEYLVVPSTGEAFLLEVNPRIQVEHTVTEQVTKLDLVSIQLFVALGCTFRDLKISNRYSASMPFPLHTSIQVRINAEIFQPDGNAYPTAGALSTFAPPHGPAYRLDTAAHAPFRGGRQPYKINPSFDSLLAKLIVTAPTYESALQLAERGLERFQIAGCETNRNLLRALLKSKEMAVAKGRLMHTGYVQENAAALHAATAKLDQLEAGDVADISNTSVSVSNASVDKPEGTEAISVPMAGVVVSVDVKEGDTVAPGQQVAVLEAMKMEHIIRANAAGVVKKVAAGKGDSVNVGAAVAFYQRQEDGAGASAGAGAGDTVAQVLSKTNLDDIPPALQQLRDTKAISSDAGRVEAVKKRHAAGYRTATENLKQLVDEDSFIEYGDLAMAAQRSRIDLEKLRATTSNDGVITGWATVNAKKDGIYPSPWRTAICIYDYMVLAGTQGYFHHLKLDRLFNSVLNNPAPLILYAEGGGGRPGDTDVAMHSIKIGGLDTPSFALLASLRAAGILSIGVGNGYLFAGNAALLGTCDFVIATRGGDKRAGDRAGKTSIGMGGPAMISGGGLGDFKPQDVGPTAIHEKIGSVDVVVPTEVEATDAAKHLLGYFQILPPHLQDLQSPAQHADQRILRHLMPSDRKRAYDVKGVIRTLADEGSFFEVGAGWGHSLITGFLRIDGQPLGLIASSVLSPLGGAIDVASSNKATRLVQTLCRTQAMHLLVLCDTPGFMVGPEAEKEGGLRAFAEWFAATRSFEMSGGRIFGITLRKAYGLGAQALLGGSTLSNFFGVSWVTGEFAGMGIEGAVRLGMRKELESVPEGSERDEMFKGFVDMMYERGKAANAASVLEIDTVIDPADTRRWIKQGLATVGQRVPVWMQRPVRSNSSKL